MKNIIKVFVLLIVSISALADERVTLLDGALSIEIPDDFRVLQGEPLEQKYKGKKNKPAAEISNRDETMLFTLNWVAAKADKNSMKGLHKQLSAMFNKAEPKAEWKKDKVIGQLGTKVAVFEYQTLVLGDDIYHIKHAFPVNGQLVLFSYVGKKTKYSNNHVKEARKILASIVLN